jgi:hypothetical protein
MVLRDFATGTVPTALIDLSLTKSVDNIAPVVGSTVVFYSYSEKMRVPLQLKLLMCVTIRL